MMTFDFNDGNGLVPAHQHVNGGGWVADTANVAPTAYVGPDARVFGNAQVYGDAKVCGDAKVYGDARVFDDAWVFGNAQVFGTAQVCGNAWVCGDDNAAKIAELNRKVEDLQTAIELLATEVAWRRKMGYVPNHVFDAVGNNQTCRTALTHAGHKPVSIGG